MGRFYKTSQAKYVQDKMFQPDLNVMAAVIGKVDKQIEDQSTSMVGLHDSLKAQGLKYDQPELQSIIEGYSKKVEDMSTNLQSDPLNFRRQTSALKALGQEIKSEWETGKVSAIQNNKKIRDDFYKETIARVKAKEGKVIQSDVDGAMRAFDANYESTGGVNYKGKEDYNKYHTEGLANFVNIDEFSEERSKNYMASIAASSGGYSDGKMLWSTENKTKGVSPERIRAGAQAAMLNDKELNDYYNQQVKFGMMSPEEVEKRKAIAIERVVQKYSFSETETGRKMAGADPAYMHGLQIAAQTHKAKLDKDFEVFKGNLEAKAGGAEFVIAGNLKNAEQRAIVNSQYSANLIEFAREVGMELNPGDSVTPNAVKKHLDANMVKLQAAAKTDVQRKAVKGYADRLAGIASTYRTNVDASWLQVGNLLSDNPSEGLRLASSLKKQAFDVFDKDIGLVAGQAGAVYIDGKKIKDASFNQIISNPKLYGLTLPAQKYGTTLDANDFYVKGSMTPMIISKDNWNQNDMISTYEVGGKTITIQNGFNQIGIKKIN